MYAYYIQCRHIDPTAGFRFGILMVCMRLNAKLQPIYAVDIQVAIIKVVVTNPAGY